MNRAKSFCPCCGQVVEWLNDHLTPHNQDYRCGNCFEGISESELGRLQDEHAKIEAAHKAYQDALGGVRR